MSTDSPNATGVRSRPSQSPPPEGSSQDLLKTLGGLSAAQFQSLVLRVCELAQTKAHVESIRRTWALKRAIDPTTSSCQNLDDPQPALHRAPLGYGRNER